MTIDPQQTPAPHARRALTWRRYLRFWGPHAASDVDDELRFHIEMRERDYLVRGMSPTDARTAAVRRLGDLDAARAACISVITRRERRMARAELIDVLRQDIRFALRTLGRQKAWTAVAVLTLALGIGANTAMFSVVESALWHPLPYPDADRLVFMLQQPTQAKGDAQTGVFTVPTAAAARVWLDASRSFLDVTAFGNRDVLVRARNATNGGSQSGTNQGVMVAHEALVMPGFLRFAGGRPLVGRSFSESEAHERAHVAMISEAMWRSRFASSATVVGRPIAIDDSIYTIIGVMPASVRLPRTFGAPEGTDLWLPRDLSDDSTFSPTLIARLHRGVTMKDAAARLDSITARAERAAQTARPAPAAGSAPAAEPVHYKTVLLRPGQLTSIHDSLVMLTGAVALVMLIACVNVAHLLLARAASREREMAVRTALGASRPRLLRQLVTESLVLAAAGCAAGVGVAWLAVQALETFRPASLAELANVQLNGATLGLAVAIALVTGVVFGIVGAVHGGRYAAHHALKGGARSVGHTARQRRTRSALVVSEMAVSATLVVGAALLVRSLIHLQTMDPGFQPAGLYSLQIPMVRTTQAEIRQRTAQMRDLEERARHLPGVSDAAIADAAPPTQSFYMGSLQAEGQAPPPPGTTSFINYNGTEPAYFRLLGLRIVQGTTFTDTSKSAAQVVVNEGMAHKEWPGQSPIGRRLRIVNEDGSGDWYTVVGVAANSRVFGLTGDATTPMLFAAASEHFNPTLLIRTSGLAQPIAALRAMVAQAFPALPQADVKSVADAMSDSITQQRFTMLLLGVFSVLALVLAAVGLYGVMAYAVAQRTREIGIRMALGASRRDVGRAVVRQGVTLAVIGGAIGLAASLWATSLLTKMLYGVAHTDIVSFVTGAVVLLGTAVAACAVPARRAVSIDPAIAMRAD
ncbi:MAG TPA: ABC transporter permease [Gemmatimonadaceae bacterium]|nr:ABC transporter permease [Gemmatimonadaceae bacterium]